MGGTLVKSYGLSTGWKIFAWLFTVGCLAISVLMFFLPYLDPHMDTSSGTVMGLVLSAFFFFLGGYMAASILKSRFEIWSDRIRDVGIFKTDEIKLDDLAGYRMMDTKGGQVIKFISRNSPTVIRASLVFDDPVSFQNWVDKNVKNLDEADAREEEKEAETDDHLGGSREERKEKLKAAKQVIKFLGGAALALTLWGFIRPEPYHLVVGLLLAAPLISIGFLFGFGGAIRFNIDNKTSSVYPSIDAAFLIPIVCLSLRAVLDWHLLAWDAFWVPFSCFTLALWGFLQMASQDARSKTSSLLVGVLFCAVWGYGTTVTLNGILDKGVPATYPTQVLAKRISTGKHTSYYLNLAPWGPVAEPKEVDVGSRLYRQKSVGDPMTVYLYGGAFHIPWYFVR